MRLSLVVVAPRACASIVGLFAALGGAAGCEQTFPGAALGTYSVVESLVANSCGAGLPALSTVEMDVELRSDEAVGYWRLPRQGVIAGSYRESDGAFEFRSARSVVAWLPDVDLGVLGCTIEQREVIRGVVVPTNVADAAVDGAALDAGDENDADGGVSESPELLVGEHTVDVIAARGSDCGALLAAQGGSFDAMPCSVRYTLSGVASATTF